MADEHADAEQSIEGHTPVPENPHAEYGLTENIQRIVENEKTTAEKVTKQKVDPQTLQTLQRERIWIRPWFLFSCRACRFWPRKGLRIPSKFLAAFLLKNKSQFEERN